MKELLNKEQHAVVFAPPNGILLVEALAGSGKTRCLRHRVPFLLQQRKNEGLAGKALVMAFNQSVAAELDQYFKKTLRGDELGSLMVKTFHGMATYMLYRFLKATPIKSESFTIPKPYHMYQALEDHLEIIGHDVETAAIKLLLELEGEAFGLGQDLTACMNQHKKGLQFYGIETKYAVELCTIMRAFRINNGLLTHNDTLPLANELPESCFAGLRFTDVLADELQDLNFQQRRFVQRFMKTARGFTGVGDPNQSIFGFAGCDPQIFSKLLKDFPGAKKLSLTTNYRSTDQVLSLANLVLKQEIKSPHAIVGLAAQGPQPQVLQNGVKSLEGFLKEIQSTGVSGKNTAILYRTRAQAPELEMVLATSGIPYTLRDHSFFNDMVVSDMVAYLNLLYHPKAEEGDFRRIFNHHTGLGAGTSAWCWKATGGKPKAWLLESKSIPGPVNRMKKYSEWNDLKQTFTRLSGLDNPIKVVTALREILEPHWTKTNGKSLEDRLRTADAFVAWVSKFQNATGWDVVKTIQEIEQGSFKHNNNPDALTLTTVHRAKGLEWDAVCLWNVVDGAFPLKTRDGDDAEEKRLLYVAVTRAKKFLTIIAPNETARNNSCLIRLLDKQEGVISEPVGANPFTRTS